MTDSRDVYMNAIQQRIFYTQARDVRVLASRRFGKTEGVISPRMVTMASALPGASFAFLGTSRKQLYTRTIPATVSAIERVYKFREGVHFGWGRMPSKYPKPIIAPKTWDNVLWFANGSIFNLISLAVIGSANGMSLSGLIADECKFLPKVKIDGEVIPALSGQTHPLGDERFSEHNPFYKSTCFVSDASLTARGNWLEKEEAMLEQRIEDGPLRGKTYQEVQDWLIQYADRVMFYNELLRSAKRDKCAVQVLPKDLVEAVKVKAQALIDRTGPFTIIQRYKTPGINKSMLNECIKYGLIDQDEAELLFCHKYLITPEQDFEMQMLLRSGKFQKKLNEYRCNAFCFFRGNALDNVNILGSDYLLRMKRDLPPLTFAISVLNQKCTKVNDGFYFKLDIENIHGYIPDDCPAIDQAHKVKIATDSVGGTNYEREYETVDFSALEKVKDCSVDGDIVDSMPLSIALDYNAKINWIVTGQVYRRDGVEALNVLSSMFAKNERTLRDLCQDWCRYYRPHQQHCREVKYYYDSTAKYALQVFGPEHLKDIVISELTRHGWLVTPIDMGNPMPHKVKYNEINSALGGHITPAIRINRENNEALIVALEMADVKIGKNGFEKDKSGEKLSEDTDDAIRREYRTDATDAFDTLWIGTKYHTTGIAIARLPMGRR